MTVQLQGISGDIPLKGEGGLRGGCGALGGRVPEAMLTMGYLAEAGAIWRRWGAGVDLGQLGEIEGGGGDLTMLVSPVQYSSRLGVKLLDHVTWHCRQQ